MRPMKMSKLIVGRLCALCSFDGSTLKVLTEHYVESHSSEVELLYLEDNLTRENLGTELRLSINSVKNLIAQLGLVKPRHLLMKNVWASASKEDKSSRTSQIWESRRSNPENFTEAAILKRVAASSKGGTAASVEAKKEKALRKEAALRVLDGGFALPYGKRRSDQIDLNSAYRSWRHRNQAAFCDICLSDSPGGYRDFAVDHCHQYQYLRGFLCLKCNTMLGWFENWRASIEAHLNRELGLYSGNGRGIFLESLKNREFGYCNICLKSGSLAIYEIVVDHDHTTDQIRGLLCNTCNIHLGWIEARQGMIDSYLQTASQKKVVHPW